MKISNNIVKLLKDWASRPAVVVTVVVVVLSLELLALPFFPPVPPSVSSSLRSGRPLSLLQPSLNSATSNLFTHRLCSTPHPLLEARDTNR
jgi:hypothetical protein